VGPDCGSPARLVTLPFIRRSLILSCTCTRLVKHSCSLRVLLVFLFKGPLGDPPLLATSAVVVLFAFTHLPEICWCIMERTLFVALAARTGTGLAPAWLLLVCRASEWLSCRLLVVPSKPPRSVNFTNRPLKIPQLAHLTHKIPRAKQHVACSVLAAYLKT